ncbi:MAG TPA: hydroxymethylbilane synthase [Chthoniobacterales bacterium]|nr:hydroxymethylbilane synthase [Chthoniobacterales bacterium]
MKRASQRIVLGTRGSDLARAQTGMVERELRAAAPEAEIAIAIIRTSGDERRGGASFQLAEAAKVQVGNLRHGRKGMFTAEIERALLDGTIDVAVHSAKDLPSEATAGLAVCAALRRAPVEDALITKIGGGLRTLPSGATVATGSVRRQHQLRHLRADLNVIELSGNVPTRLRKLTANPWDGIILARAGLERLGHDCAQGELAFEGNNLHAAILPLDEFLPAGGQGIVALEARADDENTRHLLASISDEEAFLCLRAEREFLRLLEGDCGTPVGVMAAFEEGAMTMRAQLFEEGRVEPRAAVLRSEGRTEEPEALAARLLELING